MNLIVRAAPKEHFPWLFERASIAPAADFCAIEALDGQGRIRGMCGYENWTHNSVQTHIAVEAPIVWRPLLGPIFRYPFVEAGRGVILAIVSASNTKSVETVKHLGFTEAHRVVDGWTEGTDLILFEMRKRECRWLGRGLNHG